MGQVGEEKENLRTDHHEYWIRAPPTPDGGGGTPPPFLYPPKVFNWGKPLWVTRAPLRLQCAEVLHLHKIANCYPELFVY